MSIIDGKRNIFSKIAAVNALGNIPNGLVNSSFSSVNNKTNSTDFLIDLATALIGARALRDYVVDTISYRLPQIEEAIKEGLKLELKKLVSCDVNPSVPTWLKDTGDGVELKITDIDFFGIMKVNPESFEGGLIYTDAATGINSKDFNTYLYNTIQTPGTPTNWGSSVTGTNILKSEFIPSGTINNVIKYNTSVDYSNKKLVEFNNDFIDSLSLFGNPDSLDSSKVITLILEELFGSISSVTKKSKKQIESELELKEVLDFILDSENDVVDDNFFDFDNPTLARIDRESNDRRKGIRELKTCGNLKVQVGSGVANQAITNIDATTTKVEEVSAIVDALNNAADVQASFASNDVNRETIRTNFFIEIVKKLQRVVMSAIMTPEFITLFAINHQIIYGQGSSYDGPIDFVKKNRKLVKSIGKIVLNMLLNLLLNLVLLYITNLLKQKFADDKIEKAKNYVSILLSYSGVPPNIIAQIRKINTQSIPK
tara:strand:- start:1706 stop:3160 length:1455 start_codon:yes stop_codon:yes gene_type:complete